MTYSRRSRRHLTECTVEILRGFGCATGSYRVAVGGPLGGSSKDRPAAFATILDASMSSLGADDGRAHRENSKAYVKGERVWSRQGIVVGLMSGLPTSIYEGDLFDISCTPIVPREPEHVLPIWCFCSSEEYSKTVRRVDPMLKVTNATLAKVPFDLAHWQSIAATEYPQGLPEPYSDDPTQWLFHGHPCGSVVWDEESKWTARGPLRADASVLQVAVARLLGYRWPAELDPDMRLAAESRAWVERCRELDGFADADGIVCIQAAAGELPAADRLRRLLAAAYGDEWSAAKEQELLAAGAGGKGQPRSLDDWLRDRFFAEHFKLFHNRPFIWHIWDGRKDGFHALVNYHRLCGPDGEGRRVLETLAYRHLGEWIDRQQGAQSQGEEGADARLAAAQDLQRRLTLILEGEPPYELFVRWRPLHEQPLGWAPNLDDGVRLNIRPFMRAELQSGGRKGAGILRVKPNIKWSKDRGKEPESLRPRRGLPLVLLLPRTRLPRPTARTTRRRRKPHTMATAGTTFTTRALPKKRHAQWQPPRTDCDVRTQRGSELAY